jgi:hypothetical protein
MWVFAEGQLVSLRVSIIEKQGITVRPEARESRKSLKKFRSLCFFNH